MARMDLLDIGRYLAALLMVLALLGFAALAVRRFGMPGVLKPQGTRRLAVVETLMIAPRQKLYLLRRDGVEHLVMSGPEGISVVESGIVPPATVETAQAEAAA
jgi:flagellar protein FliO/FliZ